MRHPHAFAAGEAVFVPDLRNDFDQSTSIEGGMLFRKGNVVQVWMDTSSDQMPHDGRTTWLLPSIEDAIETFEANR